MKKVFKLLSLLLVIAMFATACGNKNNSKNNGADNKTAVEDNKNTKDDKLVVYATVYPLYDFAKEIGKDKLDVHLMIPNGQEPHDWEPGSDDIKNLDTADMFIYNGANLESWADKVIESLDNRQLVTVKATEGVKLEDITEDGKKMVDPHTWLDPKNAIIEAKNITDALVTRDPQNAEFYSTNFEELSKKLKQLDYDYSTQLGNVKNHVIVVSHEAYGYLCKDYGLTQIGIEGVNAETEPDAKTMAQIVDLVRKDHIKVIFTEDIVDPKVASTIANEAGVKTEFLNPLESLTDQEIKDHDNYVTIMQQNLKKLVEALN